MSATATPGRARMNAWRKKASLLLAMIGATTLAVAASGPNLSGPVAKPAVENAAPEKSLQAPATKPQAAQPSTPVAVPAKQEPVKAKGEKKATPAGVTAKGSEPAVTAKREVKPAEEAKKKEQGPPPLPPLSARRDPFRNPLLSTGVAVSLPPGKAGLIITQLRVDGLVRAPNGMIAVVSNTAKRTYFLREGDQLYDGFVQKITSDGVTFQQSTKDVFGRAISREVVKRLYPTTAGEER